MTYKPSEEQRKIIDSGDPVLLVCGGAGTGKTTTAAAAVRAHLERVDRERAAAVSGRGRLPVARALFLSFSRSSVAQILDRTADVLGPYLSRIEITTFHAFAWRLLIRWGGVIGLADPQMLTDAEAKLFRAEDTLRYRDMMPRALDLCAVPAVREHLQGRWSIIVSDEFQDTDDCQFDLLSSIRGAARLLLLGDPNQCIYSDLPDAVGVGPQRLDAAMAMPAARRIDLPDVSHRDPSNILPAAAAAIRRREFEHDAVRAALDSGRLLVRAGLPLDREADVVAEVVQNLREEGATVGVFSHHVDATTGLSDQLTQRVIDHEIVGLPECLTAALEAQHAMLRFAARAEEWELVRQQLAVFVASSVRGKNAPDLAWMLLGRRAMPATLDRRLTELRDALLADQIGDAAQRAAAAHTALGLPQGEKHWQNAAQLLEPLVARASRRHADPAEALEHLAAAISDHRAGLLTHVVGEPAASVQLMGLYQTKGREADATIVVLRSSDFYGFERYEPFVNSSKLLYVVLSRARRRTVVLLFGDNPQPLVAPLIKLAS
ncbi:DNA helicase-2/ATP-dependent DNA helicase PcrA [Asanoa ferruginea]|uniref:DNA helicase-2/ATP-dependent DNA helicase PcrA n=1 Tax=Asanoa ferruginea TaxID=53367 RepID=A0A3D9ZJY4_9ACTN|nr:UvrD-helicase domain-containing protein [Asanoa ferruginea]REF97527.1 DNA helicase-2/ATP-dependent DNA helicase PcrA [Asanoa ferruginea]GIF48184.1 hypothetical protein Afe04nite_27230 [Asanoa ferruginea]